MIFISKMDSEQMVRKKEPVSISSILEEQTAQLLPLMQKKNLQMQYRKDADFIVEGDHSYLEKAMFNLIENAVSHNRADGMIRIHTTRDTCIIENTADPIPEEDLLRVFDIFYTTNQSRSNADYHRGLGLYLTKRILDLHGIHITLENTAIGVSVTIHVI